MGSNNRPLDRRFTREQIADAVANSASIVEVLERLHISYRSGAAWLWVRRAITTQGLDASHFNRGKTRRSPSANRRAPAAIFARISNGYRLPGSILKRAMLETGVENRCARCGLGTEWNGQTLTLEVDHIDGDWRNCLRENLRLLCPNCHSQQPTSRNEKLRRPTVSLTCEVCGREFTRRARKASAKLGSTVCSRRCAGALAPVGATKIDWPEADTLKQMALVTPINTIAKQLGVASGTLRKRLDRLGIKSLGRGYWQKLRASRGISAGAEPGSTSR